MKKTSSLTNFTINKVKVKLTDFHFSTRLIRAKFSYILLTIILSVSSFTAQDVAIIGWDGSGSSSVGDEVSFVLLRDFTAGEVIYVTEDEYSDVTGNFNSGEGHLAYTVPAGGLLEGEVLNIAETSSGVYSEQCGTGGSVVGVAGSGGWSLVSDGLGGMADEIYIYTATNPASPWDNIDEIHSFIWSAVVTPPVDQVPTNDYRMYRT